jgi:hypothetical protein
VPALSPVKSSHPVPLNKPVPRVPFTPQAKRPPPPTDSNPIIPVYLRIRPLLGDEDHATFEINENTIVARPPSRSQMKHFAERSFTFTHILGEESTQSDVFEQVAMPLLRRFMHGVDALLFAYGATSAGKTHTVSGSATDPGLIPRTLCILLQTPAPPHQERRLLCSCVEVYNERLIDLFGESKQLLRIGRDGCGLTTVKGLTEFEIGSEEDIAKTLKDLESARRQCSARFNAISSRSHCVFMLKFVTIPLDARTGLRTTDASQIRCSRMSIVDLAGSERVSPSDTSSQVATDARNINKSMLVLGRCIREIRKAAAGEAAQVPFRESKLTEMFRDFFEPGGPRTMAAIMVNISPSTAQFDDTLFSLQFAAEAIECTVRGDSDEDFEIATIDLDDDIEVAHAQREAKIRQEVYAEMMERFRQMQENYRIQIEQARAQSDPTYTSRLQQVLAAKVERETRSHELEECIRERDRERARANELEKKVEELMGEMAETKAQLEKTLAEKAGMEANMKKMIEATKTLHEKYLQARVEIQQKSAEKEEYWKKRVAFLEGELERLNK